LIILTRLGCKLPIAINPDLIERAERTPDTVITLVDGHKLVVEEPLDDVVALVRSWRAGVAAEALTLARIGSGEAGARAGAGAGAGGWADDHDHEHEHLHSGDVDDAVAADKAAHGTVGGRVLRLPLREV
jgi:flagellar protein FlbD